jgi:hypothetical protein
MSDGPHDSGGTVKGFNNKPLQDFLVKLAVDEDLRQRYGGASREQKITILAEEFQIGDTTIRALLLEPSLDPQGAVTALLDFSDQQAQTTPTPPQP